MSQLKLTADSGGGTVAIKAPASTTGNAAFELTVPGTGNRGLGKILQIVEGTLTAGFTTTSTSMVDLGLSASITPSATSSKILVLLSLGSFINVTQHKRAFANILRGSTVLFVGDAGTGEEVTIARNLRNTQDSYVMDPVSRSFLDSPSTTSATTYKVQVSVASDGGTLYVNRAETLDANAGNTASSLILMEVAA
jgi:hypothetical protein